MSKECGVCHTAILPCCDCGQEECKGCPRERCPDCENWDCDWCIRNVNIHYRCTSCSDWLVCDKYPTCKKCIPDMTWITPTVAVGSFAADKNATEVVVDLRGENVFELEEMVENLPLTSILFRCESGLNMSAAAACLYLKKHFGMTFEKALKITEEKRPRVYIDDGFRILVKNRVKDRLWLACVYENEQEIRRLAPLIDLNNTRFRHYISNPSPLLLVLKKNRDTRLAELLLSLGEVVTPYDASCILHRIWLSNYPKWYIEYFREKGYNLEELSRLYDGEYKDEYLEDSDEEKE